MSSARAVRNPLINRVGKPSHEPDQLLDVVSLPRCEHRCEQAFARSIDCVGHLFALRGNPGFAAPAIRGSDVTLDQFEALQLRDLPADGRVIASDPVSEIDDADRSSTLDRDEQGEQRAVERDSRLPDHDLIGLWAIEGADDIEQRSVQRPDPFANMCILHSFS